MLQSMKELSGQIAVNSAHDIVLFKTEAEGELTVLPSDRVTSIHFYDMDKNINRKFISIQDKTVAPANYRLYEVVIQGDVSVLRRPEFDDPRDEVTSFDYFVRLREKEVVSLNLFRSKVYNELVRLSENRVSEYVSNNRLNPARAADVIRIIEFFNRQDYTFKHQVAKSN